MKFKTKKRLIFITLLVIISTLHTYKNRAIVSNYSSKYHNYTLTFPSSWNGKYHIVEKKDALVVTLNNLDNPELFTITTNLNDTLDDIPGVPKKITVNDTEYLIGGPTAYPFSFFSGPKSKKRYEKMRNEIKDIISSIS